MATSTEHRPGDPVPATGHYEELNVFGTPTVHHVVEGEPQPAAPRGFKWRQLVRRKDE